MFYEIINRIVNHPETPSLSRIVFQTMSYHKYSVHMKFDVFYKSISNIFFNEQDIEDCKRIFCKIQNVYFAFSRLARIAKFKYAKVVVEDDMCLNTIDRNHKNTIVILQENKLYLFVITDLIRIINTSLLNNYYFISTPVMVKNPYSNKAFEKSTLYNIYYFVKFRTCYVDELLDNYFRCNFNLKMMLYKNEYILREYSISDYVNNTTTDILYTEVKEMIKYMNNFCSTRFKINNEFPKKTLVDIFRPYLYLYMSSMYSLVTAKREKSFCKLAQKYIMFYDSNPTFGRKIIRVLHKNVGFNQHIRSLDISFNERHPSFNTSKSDVFLTSHMDS
jgi:hypothetical protein